MKDIQMTSSGSRPFATQLMLDQLGQFAPWCMILILFLISLSGYEAAGYFILPVLIISMIHHSTTQARVGAGLIEATMRLDRLEANLDLRNREKLNRIEVSEADWIELKAIESDLLKLMVRWPLRKDTRYRLHHRLARVALLRGDFLLCRCIVSRLCQEQLGIFTVDVPIAGSMRQAIAIHRKRRETLLQQHGLAPDEARQSFSGTGESKSLAASLFDDKHHAQKNEMDEVKGDRNRHFYLPLSLSCSMCQDSKLETHLQFMWIEASMALSDFVSTFHGLAVLSRSDIHILSLDESLRKLVLQSQYELRCGMYPQMLQGLKSKLQLSELLPAKWTGSYLGSLSDAASHMKQLTLADWLRKKAALIGHAQID